MEVVFELEPPCTEMPPAWGPLRPKRLARARVVCFSIMVRAGDTSYVWTFVLRVARISSAARPGASVEA